MVDVTLSGDNAIVIAAAARPLPPALRTRALIAGAGCAVLVLVAAATFATRLLSVKFLQIVGGIAILWIAIGLFKEEAPLEERAAHVSSFWKAMWFIFIADITMSTDNILAVAGIAQGDVYLLLIGLGISIPLIIFASNLLMKLMASYPAIIYIGAALLGRVAGQMIMTDHFTVETFAPSPTLNYAAQAIGTAGVLTVGALIKTRQKGDSHL